MTTQILALLDDEAKADAAAKEIVALGYDDLTWEFITDDTSDIRIMPGIPAARGSADLQDPIGFVQETDAPNTYSLDDMGLDDEEKAFYAAGLDRNAILLHVNAPDEAADAVERILREHNAGRYMETDH